MSIYAHYADRVRSNIQEERYFEAMAVAVTCLDVLVHDMVEGLLLYHKDELDALQIAALRWLEQARLTAGQVIDGLEEIHVLDPRLLRALRGLNRIRNDLLHPFEGGQVKPDAIMPGKGDDESRTSHAYRLLCHIIDVSGGQSPRTQEREYRKYIRDRRRESRQLKDRGNT